MQPLMGKHFNTKKMKEGLTPITYQYAKDSKVQTDILHIQHTLFTFAKACTHVQNMGNNNHTENSTRLFKVCIFFTVSTRFHSYEKRVKPNNIA